MPAPNKGRSNMAKPATPVTGDKPKRVVNSDLTLYLVGPSEAVSAIVAVEKDSNAVLGALNDAAERGETLISRRFIIKRSKRGKGPSAEA